MSSACTLIWHSQTKHVLGIQSQSSSNANNPVVPEQLLVSGWELSQPTRLDFHVESKASDGTEQLKATVIQDATDVVNRWGYYRIVDGQTERLEKKIDSVILNSTELKIIFAKGASGTQADPQTITWCQIESDGFPTLNRIASPAASADDISIVMSSLPANTYRVLVLALGRQPFFKSFTLP